MSDDMNCLTARRLKRKSRLKSENVVDETDNEEIKQFSKKKKKSSLSSKKSIVLCDRYYD